MLTVAQCRIDPRFEALVRALETKIPFNKHLGIAVEHLVAGACILKVPFGEHLIGDRRRPAIHGGVISTLADTAGGAACFSMLQRASDRVSTVDLRVDYLRPGPSNDLRCLAEVVRMGNRVAVTRMEVFAETDSDDPPCPPIATAHGVYNVVRRE